MMSSSLSNKKVQDKCTQVVVRVSVLIAHAETDPRDSNQARAANLAADTARQAAETEARHLRQEHEAQQASFQ